MRDRTLQSKLRARRPAIGRSRVLLILATLTCCALVAAKNGAQQVDSGWAVATQLPVGPQPHPVDPRQQAILHHLLQQTQISLLPHATNVTTIPAADAAAKAGISSNGTLRFAVRPDGIEGWRPASPSATPANEPWRVHVAAPQLNAPGNVERESHEDAELASIENASTPAGDEACDAPELGCSAGDEECGVQEEESGIADEPGGADDTPAQETKKSTLNWSRSFSNNDSTEAADEEEPAKVEEPTDEVDEEDDNAFGALLNAVTARRSAEQNDDAGQPVSQAPEQITEQADDSSNADIGPITEDDENQDEAQIVAPAKPTPPPPLNKQLLNLRSRVRTVLKGYYRRQLNSREHDPWEVMHGMLAYGVHSRIRQGGPRGEPVTSVGWLCYNKPCKNLTLLYVTPKGELRAKYGVGLQGHLGQMLAMLAQCRVSEEYPIRIGKREFTIKDLIEAEKKTCYPKSELTFKLIAFQYYLDLNDEWVNDQGVEWDIPRMIREELAQPIRGAACGGTHRLSSLSLTVKTRQRRGEPLDGEYARAAEFVQKYHRYAFGLQNRDGSLSTNWFRGRGDESDINRRIKTTGHILEWLCYSLSDEELRKPQTIAAVSYLANLMYSKYDTDWEVGPMCHAIHALLIYDERVFQPFDGEDYQALYKPKPRQAATAKRPPQGATMRR